VNPIQHVIRGHEEIERVIYVIGLRTQSVQLVPELREQVLRMLLAKVPGHVARPYPRENLPRVPRDCVNAVD
jgi:hypothetical protein